MARKTDAELLTEAGVIKHETAAAANTAVRVGEMLEDIIDSKGANYAVYSALLTQNDNSNVITLGTPTSLIIGVTYLISVLEFGDDFTNVGAINNTVGERFIATGTTPTQWTMSELQYNEATPVQVLLKNEVDPALYWEYASDGIYRLRSPNGVFLNNKIIVFLQCTKFDNLNGYTLSYKIDNDNTITISTLINTSNFENKILENSPIEVRIYQ